MLTCPNGGWFDLRTRVLADECYDTRPYGVLSAGAPLAHQTTCDTCLEAEKWHTSVTHLTL